MKNEKVAGGHIVDHLGLANYAYVYGEVILVECVWRCRAFGCRGVVDGFDSRRGWFRCTMQVEVGCCKCNGRKIVGGFDSRRGGFNARCSSGDGGEGGDDSEEGCLNGLGRKLIIYELLIAHRPRSTDTSS